MDAIITLEWVLGIENCSLIKTILLIDYIWLFRYNAEKKKIGMYYSTPVYQFRMKCHLCNNHFEIKTDPGVIIKNFDVSFVIFNRIIEFF